MTNVIIALCFSAFESVWRRTHGGGKLCDWYDKYLQKWLFGLNHRLFFTILNLVAVGLVGFFVKGLEWWKVLAFIVSVELFWDMSFGMYMDMGRFYPPTEENIRDYRKTPLNFILDWMFPKSMKYGRLYDFCQMWFRYTWPLVMIPLFGVCSWWIMILGLCVALSYELGWILSERFGFVVEDSPTCLAEYLSGAISGLLWILL